MERHIDDLFILDYFYANPNSSKINGHRTTNIPEDIQSYLSNRFPDSETNKETIMRIKYGPIEERPKCPICGKPVRWYGHSNRYLFFKTCCEEHENILRKQSTKKTVNKKYNVENVFQLEEVKEKSNNTCIQHYGCVNPMLSQEIRYKAENTCLKRYGVRNGGGSELAVEKIKLTHLRNYGVTNHMKLPKYKELFSKIMSSEEVQDKMNKTKHKNNSFTTSNPENIVYEKLQNLFGKDNVIRNHKSEIYPYKCDFYILNFNIYIEYQGTWLHGDHPYNSLNVQDQERLYKLLSKDLENHPMYKTAIDVWTISDPKKRETAKLNNLNYIEFWNIKEVEDWIEKQKTILDV